MLIKYMGHSCFKVRDNETGYSIIFDPYEPGSVPGYRDVVDSASCVICSHDHFDHNYSDAVNIEPRDESPYEVSQIEAWHDPEKGALRGPNNVTIVTEKKTGCRLVHYGDLGERPDEFLTPENLELVRGADIALIPVGGTYTIDADEAVELIRLTEPKVAVPMHFRSETVGFGFSNIGTIEDFLTKANAAGMKIHTTQLYFYDTDGNDLKDCILVIRPQNIG